ncbi:MAG: hypothetical protein ABIP54_03465 [Candidatus Andersenbacteria bacterium]
MDKQVVCLPCRSRTPWPVHFFSSFRIVLSAAFFSLILITLFVANTPLALADPHAVFYTDRAQEQLFYNVLAALNQADYVEPGIGDFPYARNNLAQNRNFAANPDPASQNTSPLGPETNLVLRQTHTDLPSVVSRNITLDGNDLWTAYLLNQYALETDTRRATSELLRKLCTSALGLIGCSTNPGPANQQSEAFVTTIDQLNQPNLSAISPLGTGTQGQKDTIAKMTGTKITDPTAPADALNPENVEVSRAINIPLTGNASIDALHGATQSDQDAANTVDNVTRSVVASRYSSAIDPNTFTNIQFSTKDNQPKADFKEDTSFADQINAITGLSNLTTGAIQASQQGLEQGLAFQKLQQQTPSLAKYTLTKDGGGVKATITDPSTAISGQLASAIDVYAKQPLSLKTASSNNLLSPGQATILTRQPVTSTGSAAQQNPSQPLADASLNLSSPNAQVAGISTDQYAQDYNNLLNTTYNTPAGTSSNVGTAPALAPSFDEPANAQFGQAISNQQAFGNPVEAQCGFCTDLDPILKNSSATIGSFYSDLYCYFFPTTTSCAPKKDSQSTPL